MLQKRTWPHRQSLGPEGPFGFWLMPRLWFGLGATWPSSQPEVVIRKLILIFLGCILGTSWSDEQTPAYSRIISEENHPI